MSAALVWAFLVHDRIKTFTWKILSVGSGLLFWRLRMGYVTFRYAPTGGKRGIFSWLYSRRMNCAEQKNIQGLIWTTAHLQVLSLIRYLTVLGVNCHCDWFGLVLREKWIKYSNMYKLFMKYTAYSPKNCMLLCDLFTELGGQFDHYWKRSAVLTSLVNTETESRQGQPVNWHKIAPVEPCDRYPPGFWWDKGRLMPP